MPEQLDLIESILADVGGYLCFLLQQGALHPRYVMRAEQHEENIGEAPRALMAVKEQLGLPVSLPEEEEEAA